MFNSNPDSGIDLKPPYEFQLKNISLFVAICIAIMIVYYISAQLGLLLAFQETNASPVWPPSGIAFVAMLLFGKRIWPGIFAGAFLANYGIFIGGDFSVASAAFLSVSVGVGNTFEALIGLFLLKRINGDIKLPSDVRGAFAFIIVICLMCLISSVVGTLTLYFSGIATGELISNVWFTWWLGDAVGILTVLPVLMVWLNLFRIKMVVRGWYEFVTICFFSCLISVVVFYEWLLPEFISSLPYLVVPFMLWATFRFALLGAATSVFLISTVAVLGTVNGYGGFAVESSHVSLLLLQSFIFILASTALLLAAAIQERDKSEEELKSVNRNLISQKSKLEESNDELEAFAYSISHDLRSPLRSIDGFSQMLKEDLADSMNDESKENLNRVRSAAQRMGRLIDDLLNLSRINQLDIVREEVDVAGVSVEIFDFLKFNDNDRQVKLNCASDLKVNADPTLMRVLLENLIGNAWKYSKETEQAVIEIGARKENDEDFIFIKDNGVGFDMDYVDKLFGVFQRLHNKEIDGVGIGLAIVSRIIKRHGGKVAGKGTPGKGAEFWFSVG